MKESAKEKPIKIWRRKYIHLVSEENDIKFRGPLSYRHLRIAGWLCLLLAQLGLVLSIAAKTGLANIPSPFYSLLQSMSGLMTPLFLFATFAQVLMVKNGYKRPLLVYIAGAIGMYLAFLVLYLHFIIGLCSALTGDHDSAMAMVNGLFQGLNSGGTFSFNIFIDLLMCTLVAFFINYRPTRFFQGKWMYLFRCFVILPIAYEIGSIALKIAASNGMYLSPFLLPLLTTKPPVAFLLFIALALFIKKRERYYLKKGKTVEDYKAFLHTNVNRLHFSLFLVAAIVLAVVLDFVLFVFIFAFKVSMAGIPADDPAFEPALIQTLSTVYQWGFGKCAPMLLLIPLVIFFDYTKSHENKMVDLIIPVAGVALVALLLIEGFFEVARFSLANLKENMNQRNDAESSLMSVVHWWRSRR